jgi:hypothetical protein
MINQPTSEDIRDPNVLTRLLCDPVRQQLNISDHHYRLAGSLRLI